MIQSGGTAAATSPSETVLALNEASAVKAESIGQYGAGGGAKGSPSGKGLEGGGMVFGGASEGSSPGSLSFSGEGASGSGGDGATLNAATEDPDDYLTRIGIDESLFKRIERKHTEKQRLWLKQNRPNTLK
jgi:hypothetical protein